MSDKFCVQWNDFKDNSSSVFGKLRDDKDFTDVTLVSEDGQHMEAHKFILASSSPFFEKILQRNKHPNPLIYLKGFQPKVLTSVLDFLYFGEANVNQEDLDSFLAVAEEVKLKGLTGQTPGDVLEEQEASVNQSRCSSDVLEKEEKPNYAELAKVSKELIAPSSSDERGTDTKKTLAKPSKEEATPNKSGDGDNYRTDRQALAAKVNSMMEKGHRMLPNGAKDRNGTPRLQTSSICKVCGKEGLGKLLRDHIEHNHLEGICLPCDYCGKTYGSRNGLDFHKRKRHN